MSDVFDTAKRSWVMSQIRGQGNKTTELAMIAALRAARITGWRRHVELRVHLKRHAKPTVAVLLKVRPDFIFREARLAIFVDGCFWHRCPLHSKLPESNREFWEGKLYRNIERDKTTARALRAAGWSVMRLWEHEMLDSKEVARRVRSRLRRAMRRQFQCREREA